MSPSAGSPTVWAASFDVPEAPGLLAAGLTRWARARVGDAPAAHLALARPSFIAQHPARPVLYATHHETDGAVVAVRTDGADGDAPVVLCRRSSGGAIPCHLTVHPEGTWLYIANYGDGTVGAIALDDDGGLTDDAVDLTFRGSSVDPRRQASSHPHATTVSPGGGHLVVTDLGADALRAYPLVAGRPVGEPIVTALPAGAGPRHPAWQRDTLYVACELNGEVAVLALDEAAGRAEVTASVAATTQPAEESFYLSDIVVHGDHVIVGARGCDTLSALAIGDAGGLRLVTEVATPAWPNHFAVVGTELLVAATHAHRIVSHQLGGFDLIGPASMVAEVAAPMSLSLVP
ncbi:lactonase family protein [Occultella kanbiaonis]|uniref:lactonase family protein n=1 Tax=Occultella kanbiaonis TaxID=2675754 RepID=UPI0013D13A63|nr:beta-propeller fold lactonase family protein [Occultella kanbiaonis]